MTHFTENRESADKKKPKIVYFVTEDWYFFSHRLPIALAASKVGFEVVLVTRTNKHKKFIENQGIRVIPISLLRHSKNLVRELFTIREITRIYKREKPDLVHHVALKPVIYGSIAAKITKVPSMVNALAGLGYVFSSQQIQARVIKLLVIPIFRKLFDGCNSRVILQNPNDQNILIESRSVLQENTILIRGSGVDTKYFSAYPEPENQSITVTLVSRMLRDKGILEFVEAVKTLKRQKFFIKALLVGSPDAENPTSIRETQLEEWAQQGVVEWLGHVDNVPEIWEKSHIAVLPSYYGEGVPKSLIEAAACGRPIVTTNMPGCCEIVRDGENGLLVPIKDSQALANAIRQLIENSEMRKKMGKRGRIIVEKEFSEEIVVHETMNLYRELLGN